MILWNAPVLFPKLWICSACLGRVKLQFGASRSGQSFESDKPTMLSTFDLTNKLKSDPGLWSCGHGYICSMTRERDAKSKIETMIVCSKIDRTICYILVIFCAVNHCSCKIIKFACKVWDNCINIFGAIHDKVSCNFLYTLFAIKWCSEWIQWC